MIMANDKVEKTEAKPISGQCCASVGLSEQDFFEIFCVMLKMLGGTLGVPKQNLDNTPKGTELHADYDSEEKLWLLYLKEPAKRKRRIITRSKKLLLPSRN